MNAINPITNERPPIPESYVGVHQTKECFLGHMTYFHVQVYHLDLSAKLTQLAALQKAAPHMLIEVTTSDGGDYIDIKARTTFPISAELMRLTKEMLEIRPRTSQKVVDVVNMSLEQFAVYRDEQLAARREVNQDLRNRNRYHELLMTEAGAECLRIEAAYDAIILSQGDRSNEQAGTS